MTIVYAYIEEEPEFYGPDARKDLGYQRATRIVKVAKAGLWKARGTKKDLENAQAYAASQGVNWYVFTYPTSERRWKERAKEDALNAAGVPLSDRGSVQETTMNARTTNSAEAAGEQYADSQINSEYFSDWVRDQLREASKLPEDQVLPLETETDALVIAGKMLQQLEWDTKRDLRSSDIPGDDPAAFFVGFHKACEDARPWLAEELLTLKGEMGLREGRGVSEHVDPALVEAFAADVDALREAKGITTDQAFDLIAKPAWFQSYRGQRPEDKIDLENRIINKAKSIGRARSRMSRETPRVASRKSPKAKRSAARRRRGKDGRFR